MDRTFNLKYAIGAALALVLILGSAAFVQAKRVSHNPPTVGANVIPADTTTLW